MKKARSTAFALTAMLFVLLFQASSPAGAVESKSKISKKELRSLIENAKTRQEHEKIAAYYRRQAEQAQAKVTDHEKMAEDYKKNPATHLHMKYPDPLEYCRTLVRIYGDEAKQYTALAEYHEKMAKDAAQ